MVIRFESDMINTSNQLIITSKEHKWKQTTEQHTINLSSDVSPAQLAAEQLCNSGREIAVDTGVRIVPRVLRLVTRVGPATGADAKDADVSVLASPADQLTIVNQNAAIVALQC